MDLKGLIAYIESRGNQYALRFEPAVYAQLVRQPVPSPRNHVLMDVLTIHTCTAATASILYSMSFGRYQIMGYNVYGPVIQYHQRIFDFLDDTDAQDNAFDLFVQHMGVNYTVDQLRGSIDTRHHFAQIYNGNANAYNVAIENALTHFGIAFT
jgi:hypothetical protein